MYIDELRNKKITEDDMICNNCRKWCLPIVHDKENRIYCLDCLKDIILCDFYDEKLWAGDDLVYNPKNGINKTIEILKENSRERILHEQRKNLLEK